MTNQRGYLDLQEQVGFNNARLLTLY